MLVSRDQPQQKFDPVTGGSRAQVHKGLFVVSQCLAEVDLSTPQFPRDVLEFMWTVAFRTRAHPLLCAY